MHIDSLSPVDGHLIKRVTIAKDVPGAGSNYGYSETSAPTCANHRVVFGAAGSEYGTRGFVMAYTTDLVPAWPSPYWTIPPEQQSWRAASRIVGGGNVWTPVTVDAASDTVFFGTGSATPLYFPSVRPGPDPRTDSLIAVDLKTGKTKWWQQLISGNQWSYDVAQPPLVYDGKVGGTAHHIVSVASMEGLWFAFDATTGKHYYQRVKVIDRVKNHGKIGHNFKVNGKTTKLIAPGKSATLKVTFSKKGTFAYLCTVKGHAALGMKGKFAVGVAAVPTPTTTVSTAPTTFPGPGGTVMVNMFEYGFTLSPTAIPAGNVTFVRANTGTVVHNFDIRGVVGGVGALANPGQTVSMTVNLQAGHTYAFECDVPGHADAGMTGSFTPSPVTSS